MEFIKKKRMKTENTQPDIRVRINVGGKVFETWRSTLQRIPGTRLALLTVLGESDDTWDREKREFFFDRHPGVFSMVMQYYRTEELHTDQIFCGNIIQGELEFWGLTELDIEPCCWGHYSKFKDHKETLAALDDNFTTQPDSDGLNKHLSNYQKFKHNVWTFTEEPSTSSIAKIYAVISMCFVVISIAIFCLETYHWFRIPNPGADPHNTTVYDVYISSTGDTCITISQERGGYDFNDTKPHPAMTYLDYVCAAFFTVEFITRVFFSPNKIMFIKSPLNIIDLLCILPHFIAIFIVTVDTHGTSKATSNLFRAFLALRTVRILRIFKLMKHYSAFKILVYTIKVSTKELLLLVVFLFTGVLIFASVIFYTENDTFSSIPVGFWWALVTMTTVGYGDKVPRTEGGYLIGCFCVLCGVLTIAFTVPIVVNNFTLYYSHAQSRIKLPVHKRKELTRKIFLKNQKSLEFLQKLKWKRDKTKEQFNSIETLKSQRDPPYGQEASNKENNPVLHKSPMACLLKGGGLAAKTDDACNTSCTTTSTETSEMTAVETPETMFTVANSGRIYMISPDKLHAVSESIDCSLIENIAGVPLDASDNTIRHRVEKEKLLNNFAYADKKLKEERRRQLRIIKQKQDSRRQQINSEPRKRPAFTKP